MEPQWELVIVIVEDVVSMKRSPLEPLLSFVLRRLHPDQAEWTQR